MMRHGEGTAAEVIMAVAAEEETSRSREHCCSAGFPFRSFYVVLDASPYDSITQIQSGS